MGDWRRMVTGGPTTIDLAQQKEHDWLTQFHSINSPSAVDGDTTIEFTRIRSKCPAFLEQTDKRAIDFVVNIGYSNRQIYRCDNAVVIIGWLY